MRVFRRKSTWDKLIEPITSAKPATAVKSGLTAVGALAGVSLASAVISAVRNKSTDT